VSDLLNILLDSIFILPFFRRFYDFWWFSGTVGLKSGVARLFLRAWTVVSANAETVAPTPMLKRVT